MQVKVQLIFINPSTTYRLVNAKRYDQPPPQNKNVLVPFFYFVIALGKAAFFWKNAKIDKNVQIYKNVPKIGFLVRAGRRFLKRMETSQICRHKFVDENHIPQKVSSGLALEIRIECNATLSRNLLVKFQIDEKFAFFHLGVRGLPYIFTVLFGVSPWFFVILGVLPNFKI